ncbi:MAG: hypothetical protein ACR2NU_02590 [Aeoliella sp.]
MSKPKKRRRVFLPILLATGLASAGGAGGYYYYHNATAPQSPELSAAAQGDLDAGFEAAQGNDTLSAVAAAWDKVESSPEPHDALAVSSPPVVNDTTEVIAAQPPSVTHKTDRYAKDLLAGPAAATAAAPIDVPDVTAIVPEPAEEVTPVATEGDRYADSNVPHIGTSSSPPVSESSLAPVAETTLPLVAEPTVARGQSPPRNGLTIESDPNANPLRVNNPFGQNSPGAEAAFDATSALPTEAARDLTQEVGPDPTELQAGNALRNLPTQPSPQPDETPRPAEFSGARPMTGENTYGRFGNEPVLADPEVLQSAINPPVEAGREMEVGAGRPGERALEGPQRPALVLQKFAPQEIQVGKSCKFSVVVRNTGQRPADNVVVQDEVPQGTRFLSASPQAESSGPTLSWQLGTLSPGEERTMEIELMPTEEGEIGSVAQVTFASHASAKAKCTRPQLALRMTAPSEVLVGRQQRVTIELHNPGTGDATGVMLLENVPDNVRHASGPALELEIGTLSAGETRRMELVLTAEKPGPVTNVLTARADGNLQVQQEVEFEVIAPAISVGLEGPSKRYLERPATYTVSVDNPGTAVAKDVQLVTKLPKGMQFVRANNMGEYDSSTHSVYWSLAELPEGQQGAVELVALPIQSGDHTIHVEGRAREGLEDRTSREIRVDGLSAIMFEVSDADDPIEVGGRTSYEIRVVNQGSKAATNVQVTALVPLGMTVTGASGESRHTVQAEGVVFEPLARLAPKADTLYRVEVQGVQPGEKRLLVEVKTDDITQPIRKEESTRVFGDE